MSEGIRPSLPGAETHTYTVLGAFPPRRNEQRREQTRSLDINLIFWIVHMDSRGPAFASFSRHLVDTRRRPGSCRGVRGGDACKWRASFSLCISRPGRTADWFLYYELTCSWRAGLFVRGGVSRPRFSVPSGSISPDKHRRRRPVLPLGR